MTRMDPEIWGRTWVNSSRSQIGIPESYPKNDLEINQWPASTRTMGWME